MFTILGADGKEYGPVPADKIRDWIAGGRANAQTRIKAVGATEWTTIGALPDFAAPEPAPAAAPDTTPAAAPAAAPAALTGSPAEIAADLNARAAKIDLGDCLSRSFELWKANLLPLVGITALIIFIQMAAGMVPILGALSGIFLNGVFYGGLYYYYLGKMRGEPREISDAFAGFSKAFVPLMLATLLTSVLTILVMLPFFGPFFITMVKAAVSGAAEPPDFPAFALLFMFIGFIPMLYLSISWLFTFPLVIDRGLGPWTAMEVSRRVVGRQWFRLFFLMLVAGILAMLGLIGLIIGVFFTLPLAFGALLYAYEDSCNPPQA